MKEYRVTVVNSAHWAELSVVASSSDEAEHMVENYLRSSDWQAWEAEERRMGTVDPRYRILIVEEHDDAPDTISVVRMRWFGAPSASGLAPP